MIGEEIRLIMLCIPNLIYRIRQEVAAVSAALLATIPEWQRILTTRHVLHATLPRRMGYLQARRSALVQPVMRWLKQMQSETSYQRKLALHVRQEQLSYLQIQLLLESKRLESIHSLLEVLGVSFSLNASACLFPFLFFSLLIHAFPSSSYTSASPVATNAFPLVTKIK
jgi:hypothetical protein